MDFRHLDLNLLRLLDVLLTEGSTVKAGHRLGLSQPAVSAALKRLREVLGDPLFVRQGQGLVPTPYARGLEAPLRQSLDELERIMSVGLRFDPAASDATFRVSGTDYFSHLLMPKLAALLQRDAPRLRVQQVDLVPDSYVDTLQQYDVDLALIPDIDVPRWASKQALFNSGFRVIARKGHPMIDPATVPTGSVMPLDLYCALGHVAFSSEGKFDGIGDQALRKIGRTRRVVMTLPVFYGVWNAVLKSDLIGLLPDALAHDVAEREGLDVFLPPIQVGPQRLIMLWHSRYDSDPGHKWLRAQVTSLMRPLDTKFMPLTATRAL